MTDDRVDLGDRAGRAFERLFDGRGDAIEPRDRAEAEAFWGWLGTFDRPADPEPAAASHSRVLHRALALAAAVAAVFVLLISTGIAPSGLHSAPTPVSYATGSGERRMIDLRDGSVITLAAESRVQVLYSSERRLVRLERGEALFKVAHNAARPFVVHAAGGQVVDVGTTFDVKLDQKSSAKVTVVEGVVRIVVASKQPDAEQRITQVARKGEQVSFGVTPGRQAMIGYIGDSAKANADLVTAWTRGVLYFHGEPLSEVVATANRYTDEKIMLASPAEGSIPVYGMIAEGDTTALKELIAHPGAGEPRQ
jgi:transmembrane sensor